MPELRWIETDLPDVFDLVDKAGTKRGFVMETSARARGYVVEPRLGRPARLVAVADHATDTDARAWVEAEVRKLLAVRPEADHA